MCHHARMNAYSEDLRKKIVEALGRGATKSGVARAFGISRSSVKRYAKLAEEGRPLAPKRRPGLRPKLDDAARRLCWRRTSKRGPRRPCARGVSSCGGCAGSRSANRP